MGKISSIRMLALCLVNISCIPANDASAPPVTWETAYVQTLLRQYDSTRSATIEQWSTAWRQLKAGLKKEFNQNQLLEIGLSIPKEGTGQESILLDVIFGILYEAGDRDNLVRLLAAKCPKEVVGLPVEYYLETGRHPLGVLVLADAYACSADPAVKSAISKTLRRSMHGIMEYHGDDEEFVKLYWVWYLNYKARYKLNSDYINELELEEQPLFVKSKAQPKGPSSIKPMYSGAMYAKQRSEASTQPSTEPTD